MADHSENTLTREEKKKRFLERLKNPPGRSETGEITWTRDELYEEMFKPSPPDAFEPREDADE